MLARHVAVKRFAGALMFDPQLEERFMWEGRALAQLVHPNIVQIFDVITREDELFLVLEYVPGPTLRALLHRARIPGPSSLVIVSQLAHAISYAAVRGVVHRDLKPANVIVNPAGQCKLTDFGVAKMLTGQDAERRFRTRSGAMLGTPTYMSPEAALGVGQLDHRADIYSLAVMAYELLVGRPPFPQYRDPIAVLESHISSPVPEPRSIAPGFPPSVQAVLLRGLAKKPDDRQADANVFWRELAEAATSAWPEWEAGAALPAVVAGYQDSTGEDLSSGTRATGDDHWVHSSDATSSRPGLEGSDALSLGRIGASPDATVESRRAPLPGRGPSIADTPGPGLPAMVSARPTVVHVTLSRPHRRRTARGLVVAAACGLLIGFGIIAYVRSKPPTVSGNLTLRSVTLTVSPPSAIGHCPMASYTFTARITINAGSGRLGFDWTTPAHTTTAQDSTEVPFGTRVIDESLQFSFSGGTPATGSAILHVVRPSRLTSSPLVVRYVCP
jgi:hypothetical protein